MGKQGAFYCLCKSLDRAEEELSGVLRCFCRKKCSCQRKRPEKESCSCLPKDECSCGKNCGILP